MSHTMVTYTVKPISPDDLAQLVRQMREGGLSESTIAIAIGVTNRIYRYAARRLGWSDVNPVSLMLSSERPKPSQSKRRRIFEGAELEQTIAAADEPYRILFTLAALTGARVSELLGLTWTEVRVDDLDDAEIEFARQIDRRGERGPMKTDGSARTVPVPRELALILVRHRLASRFAGPDDYVFTTRAGGPLRQRMSVARSGMRNSTPSIHRTARPSRCSASETSSDYRFGSHMANCRRCTASGTPSPVERCSLGRAWTRLRSSLAIATRTSLAPSTCESLLTFGVAPCGARA